MAECLTNQGFPTTVRPDDGISFSEITAEQVDAFHLEYYLCEARFPVDPAEFQVLTPHEIDSIYQYYVNELVPCLTREAGAEFTEIPTMQQFQENWETGRNVWTPYLQVPEGNQEEWFRLNAECPQKPTGGRSSLSQG